MHGHPRELHADDRQERGAEQNQNAHGGDPVQQAVGQPVPDDAVGSRAAGIGA
jgi:hypothetical protein